MLPLNDLTEQLQAVHELIRSRYSFVDRIALALYEVETDLLKTFVSSNTDHVLLKQYEVPLSEVPSLARLVANRESRLVVDIAASLDRKSVV